MGWVAVETRNCDCPGHKTYGQATMVTGNRNVSECLRLLIRCRGWGGGTMRAPTLTFAFQMLSHILFH